MSGRRKTSPRLDRSARSLGGEGGRDHGATFWEEEKAPIPELVFAVCRFVSDRYDCTWVHAEVC